MIRLLMSIAFLALSSCAFKPLNLSNQQTSPVVYQRISNLPRVTPSATTLVGTWDSGCATGSGAKGSVYFQEVLQFDQEKITSDSTSFSDATCLTPVLKEQNVSYYTLENTGTDNNIKETFYMNQETPVTTAEATLLNTQKYCGLTNWTNGVHQIFTNTEASACGIPSAQLIPAELYGNQELYLTLCFGADKTACTQIKYTKK